MNRKSPVAFIKSKATRQHRRTKPGAQRTYIRHLDERDSAGGKFFSQPRKHCRVILQMFKHVVQGNDFEAAIAQFFHITHHVETRPQTAFATPPTWLKSDCIPTPGFSVL
jgi:hypothetical protein